MRLDHLLSKEPLAGSPVHVLGSETIVLGRAGTGMWNIDQLVGSILSSQYNLRKQEWKSREGRFDLGTLLGPEVSVVRDRNTSARTGIVDPLGGRRAVLPPVC